MKIHISVIILSTAILACACAKQEPEAKSPEVSIVCDGKTVTAEAIETEASVLHPLGVHPALGRDFVPADFQKGSQAAAVISADFWASALGSRADVIGMSIQVGDKQFVVVGMAPPKPAVLSGRKIWLSKQH